jgi:hypothetical protein
VNLETKLLVSLKIYILSVSRIRIFSKPHLILFHSKSLSFSQNYNLNLCPHDQAGKVCSPLMKASNTGETDISVVGNIFDLHLFLMV